MLNSTSAATHDIRPIPTACGLDALLAFDSTILVVEDEPFVREAACDILSSQRYCVCRASNAIEAQAAFHRLHGNVQLLLSDVVLPGLNGPALAKVLSALQPALKTIFISGYPAKILARYGPAFAAASYLPKPFSAECLLNRVHQALYSTGEPVRS